MTLACGASAGAGSVWALSEGRQDECGERVIFGVDS